MPLFAGSYERQGKSTYKHVYFNATFEMLVVWLMTLGVIIVSYESFKHIHNIYCKKLIRWKMLFLFILDIYPNYYSYWVYVNYINDGYYHQFFHQLFFTVSELYSTWNVFRLCSKNSESNSWRLLAIISISLIHILLGGVDQFFTQLILWRGNAFQRFRNLGFLFPDILHVLLAVQLLAEERQTSWTNILTMTERKYGSILVFSGFLIGKCIFQWMIDTRKPLYYLK